jgi:hypothetical protein
VAGRILNPFKILFMGRASTFNSVIPDDLQLFEQTDIIKMFEYIEKTFHLSNKWYPTFKESLKKVERDVSEQEHFFRYTKEFLDPSLQVILRRNDSVIFALASLPY